MYGLVGVERELEEIDVILKEIISNNARAKENAAIREYQLILMLLDKGVITYDDYQKYFGKESLEKVRKEVEEEIEND